MIRIVFALGTLVLSSIAFVGCGGDPKLSSSDLEGDWHVSITVHEVSSDALALAPVTPWPGLSASIDSSTTRTAARFRWRFGDGVVEAVAVAGSETLARFPFRQIDGGIEVDWAEGTLVRGQFLPRLAALGSGVTRTVSEDAADRRVERGELRRGGGLTIIERESWSPARCTDSCPEVDVSVRFDFVPADPTPFAAAPVADAGGFSLAALDGSTTLLGARLDPGPTFVLAADFPVELQGAAFQAVAEWNVSLMTARRVASGEPLPTAARIACQSEDPTGYCFCDGAFRAVEVTGDDTCAHREDVFTPPSARGQQQPFDCHVETADASAPYRFAGDECIVRLETNPCGAAGSGECVATSDPRHSVISVASLPSCGASSLRVDDTTGEIVSAAVAIGIDCLGRAEINVTNRWPALRTAGAPAWRAITTVPTLGMQAPEVAFGFDTTPALRGSNVEPQVAAAVLDPAARAWAALTKLSPDATSLDLASIGRGALRAFILASHGRERALAEAGIELPLDASMVDEHYWAAAFASRDEATATALWQQAILRAVLARHVGKRLGLADNLAATADRDNYSDGFFDAVLDAGQPTELVLVNYPHDVLFETDEQGIPIPTGTGDTMERYLDATERRQLRGLRRLMTSSAMDVPATPGRTGPGRADVAAIAWRYFGMREVWDGDPSQPELSTTTLSELQRGPRRWLDSGALATCDDCVPVAYRACGWADTGRNDVCRPYDAGAIRFDIAMDMRLRIRAQLAAGTASSSFVAARIHDLLGLARFAEPGMTDASFAGGVVVDWLGEMISLPRSGRYSLDVNSGAYERDASGTLDIAPGSGFADVPELPWIRALAMRAFTLRNLDDEDPSGAAVVDRVRDGGKYLLMAVAGGDPDALPCWDDSAGTLTTRLYAPGAGQNPTTGQPEPLQNLELFAVTGSRVRDAELVRLRPLAAALLLGDPQLRGFGRVYRELDVPDLPATQRDGQPTQAFGRALPGSGHAITTDPADADYLVFDSPVAPVSLVALKYRPRATYNLENGTGFRTLWRLYQHAQTLGPSPSASALSYQSQQLDAWLQYIAIRDAMTP